MDYHLDLIMFIALIVAILMGFPVAFSIAGVAIIFAYLGYLLGIMDITLLGALGQRFYGVLINDVLVAIPLFILMGALLDKSQIAQELLDTMGKLFGSISGGLGLSVILVGALLAASTGIVGATVITMGLIALPTMLKAKYNPKLASGIVCSAGTLGQIIPPSTLLIILSEVMSNAYQQAQYQEGKFSVETLSVGQLFAAAILPGLTLVALYMMYVLMRGSIRPQDMPTLHLDIPKISQIGKSIAPPILLIFAVLGSILTGIATPTEAASVGAVGAILMAGLKIGGYNLMIVIGALSSVLLSFFVAIFPVRLQRDDLTIFEIIAGGIYFILSIAIMMAVIKSIRIIIKNKMLQESLTSTMTMTSMIFATILTAGMFSLVFIGLGGEDRVTYFLSNMPGGSNLALIFCMIFIFILGFFLDFVEIAVIALPLIVPPLILMGHDPLWLSMLIAINLQTSFLTPPFGFSLFYLRGVAPKEISTSDIYRGMIPFIVLQIVAVSIIWFMPKIATMLPKLIFE